MKIILALLCLAACSSPSASGADHAQPVVLDLNGSAATAVFVREAQMYQPSPPKTPLVTLRSARHFEEVNVFNHLTTSPIDVWLGSKAKGLPIEVPPGTGVDVDVHPIKAITIQQTLVQPDPGSGVIVLMPDAR